MPALAVVFQRDEVTGATACDDEERISWHHRRHHGLAATCLQFRRWPPSIVHMYQMTDEHRTRITELCQRFGVRRLDLFGSAARDDFTDIRSDLDFVVEFQDEAGGPGLDAYFGLKEGLERLLGRSVDLVMPEAVTNPYVRADISRHRTTVYAA